jgi:hypothetical protein
MQPTPHADVDAPTTNQPRRSTPSRLKKFFSRVSAEIKPTGNSREHETAERTLHSSDSCPPERYQTDNKNEKNNNNNNYCYQLITDGSFCRFSVIALITAGNIRGEV